MDGLILTFFVLLLTENGDRTQLLAAALSRRFGQEGKIFLGLVLASLLNSLLVTFAGSMLDQLISEDPLRLFTGLAYLFAGAGMLLWRRPVDLLTGWRTGPFWTSFLGIAILQFGDKGQFIMAAHAAHWDAWFLVLIGGVAGIIAASGPAILLKEELAQRLPLIALRRFAGAIMLITGTWFVLSAFRLI